MFRDSCHARASSLPRPSPPVTHPLSLHDALPISLDPVARELPAEGIADVHSGIQGVRIRQLSRAGSSAARPVQRSEEHTSELQSRGHLVCRLLLEKKNTAIEACVTPAALPH